MKIVEIAPRRKLPPCAALVKRQAEIHKRGRGTFVRKGPGRTGMTTWSHKKYKGTVGLSWADAELVSAKVRSPTSQDEGNLLKAFLGFVDRYVSGQIATIRIHYH